MKTALVLFASFVVAGTAFAVGSSPDRDFAIKAAHDGAAEVALGRLAAAQAQSQAVKTFGQRMVDDHTRAGEALKTAARQDGIDLPADAASKPADTAALADLRGAAFDRAYAKRMVEDHEKAVALFRGAARNDGSSNLKAFAQKTLPTLEEHLRMARALQDDDGKAMPDRDLKHDADRDGRR